MSIDVSQLFADLDDLPEAGEPLPEIVKPPEPAPMSEGFVEICGKCRGSGRYGGYSSRGTQCFACKGKGRLVYKTDSATRAKSRARAAGKRIEQANAAMAWLEQWGEENPAEMAWMKAAAARGFEFARDLLVKLAKYSSISEGQLDAVRRCMARDAERAAAKKAEAEARAAAAPAVTVEAIEQAFAKAQASGIKKPRMRLDTFVFKPAPVTGRNAGALYVTENDEYLGKVQGGRFVCVAACTPDQQARIIAAASNPSEAASAYGQRTGQCCICAKELTNAESIARHIGPICAEKYGL